MLKRINCFLLYVYVALSSSILSLHLSFRKHEGGINKSQQLKKKKKNVPYWLTGFWVENRARTQSGYFHTKKTKKKVIP